MSEYSISKEILLKMMKDMLLARNFEEKVNEMFMQGKIHGTTHLSIGQEALAAGVSNALNSEDWILPTHRGHGHCIAKSGDINSIMAELFGKKEGMCKGIGGSMHMIDTAHKNLGSSGIVGGALPIAVGMGLAFKKQNINSTVTVMLGDGANNQGTFHESLNLASIWKLPILFLCENNLYGMSVPIKYSMAVEDVATRGISYNIPSEIIDGNNVIEVYQSIKKINESMKNGNGPFLLEAKTYRWLGHSKSDQRKYRTKKEEKAWKEKCPIKFFKKYLIDNEYITEKKFNDIEKNAVETIEQAIKYAENCSISSLNEIKQFVYM